MRLAVVTETFPPEINGVAMTWGQLSAGLARRGHAVTVYRPRQGPDDHGGDAAGYRQVTVPGGPIPSYPGLHYGYPVVGRLLRAWRAAKPDLVHIVTEGPLGLAGLAAASIDRLPVTSSYHTHFQQYTGHYGAAFLGELAHGYLRWVHNQTLLTFGPTPELNAELERTGFRGLKVLSRGVDTALFNPGARDAALRASWGVGPDDPVVIHCSRMAPEKNYPVLLRCYRAMREVNPATRFVLVGGGPLRESLQRENPWITFTGFVERADLARHLASADVYIHASRTETFGNVVTEAMAAGLAVAGYDYAAARIYIRPGVNGLIAPWDGDDGLVTASVRLVADAGLRAQVRREARRTAEAISWDAVVSGFERDLLAASRA